VWLLFFIGCNRAPAPAPATPAEKPKVESDLSKTTLPAISAQALGIVTEPVRIMPVDHVLRLTGIVTSPFGYDANITAPLAGVVKLPPEGKLPEPGRAVNEGDVLFLIEPVLGPTEAAQFSVLRLTVESEKAKAAEAERVAKLDYERIEALRAMQLRSQQDSEQAHVKWLSAEADLKSANAKLLALSQALRPVKCPRAGTLLSVTVTPGQTVAAAAPLAQVADLSRLWVRVAVPESDLPRINARQPVVVDLRPTGTGGARLNRYLYDAVPIALVPQVDPIRHTADLYYELTPASREQRIRHAAAMIATSAWSAAVAPASTLFARDQMLTIPVPLDERKPECVVPASAIIFDAYGSAWIYVVLKTDASTHTYERRRVEVGSAVAGGVVVRPPCKEGERVVSVGAGALFSREFFKPPVDTGEKPK
jgi:multidrug efflux pump subunit AcrA (membrane-fusion protein)